MALYYASILAEQQEYDIFIVDSRRPLSWSGHSINKMAKLIRAQAGGIIAKLIITLTKIKKIGDNKV